MEAKGLLSVNAGRRKNRIMPYPTYAANVLRQDIDCHVEHGIRVRAYKLWVRAGRPEGLDSLGRSWADHFWFQAQNELSNTSEGEPPNTSARKQHQ